MRKYNESDVKFILPITKNEKDFLVKNGCSYHEDIFMTYSGHGKYYCKESHEILQLIDNYRKSIKVK